MTDLNKKSNSHKGEDKGVSGGRTSSEMETTSPLNLHQELAKIEEETTKHYLGNCNCKNQHVCYQEAHILLAKQEALQLAISELEKKDEEIGELKKEFESFIYLAKPANTLDCNTYEKNLKELFGEKE